jgi:hypothetical protein
MRLYLWLYPASCAVTAAGPGPDKHMCHYQTCLHKSFTGDGMTQTSFFCFLTDKNIETGLIVMYNSTISKLRS